MKLRKNLETKKKAGVPYVIWRLNFEQKAEIEQRWKMEPVLYTVRTRRFQNVSKLPGNILKDIHYACKRGKGTIVIKLSNEEKELLESFNIKYWPLKYKIYLAG